MAHKCGLPYVVPRSYSIHGTTTSSLANRSVDNLPHTNTIEALHSESQIRDSMVSAQQEQRLVKSEQASPVLNAATNFNNFNGGLPPLDLSNVNTGLNYTPNWDGNSSIADFEQEQPLLSAGLSATSIDWSHFDGLDFNSEKYNPSYSQPPSWFDFNSVDQGLTSTSTSGELSEVEDFGGGVGELPTGQQPNQGQFDLGFNGSGSSYIEGDFQNVDIDQFIKDTTNFPPATHQDLAAQNYIFGEGKSTPGPTGLQVLGTGTEKDAFWLSDFELNDIGAINDGNGGVREDKAKPWAVQ